MQVWILDLSRVLNDQNCVLKKLLEIAERKKEFLIVGNTAGLDGCLNEEIPLIMKFSRLEEQRVSILKKDSLDACKLSELAEKAGGTDKTDLLDLLASMKKNMFSLKEKNDRNKKLVESNLETVNMLRGVSNAKLYGADGEKSLKTASVRNLMDRKA